MHFATDWKRKGGAVEEREMPSSSAMVRVEKATSDLLSGPDWTMNMDICDNIHSRKWQAKDVVKAVMKRLQHRNPTVQSLALTLLETVIKNCGDSVHLQVAESDILHELVKIVKKKTDMQVRDKILVMLDSWREAFGGPEGKYPQYYLAYAEVKNSGIKFPQRSGDAALIFTPQIMHPAQRRHHSARHSSKSSVRLDEAIATEMGNLSLSDLVSIRRVMELLGDMLQAVTPNDSEALKDEVIVDLVHQCRSNQNKIMHLVCSTGDEELLSLGLALNDKLRNLIEKHDAIAFGSPLPTEASQSTPRATATSTPTANPNDQFEDKEDEEEEDDGFSQLARRNSKINQVSSTCTSAESTSQEASSNSNDLTTGTASANKSEGIFFSSSNALGLPDSRAPVSTARQEQDMMSLSITVPTNPSPRHTPSTPPSASNQSRTLTTVSPTYNPQAHPVNQGYIPYNNYVVPWDQSTLPSFVHSPLPQLPQDSCSYPPPPWEIEEDTDSLPSTTYQSPNLAAMPLQQQTSFGSRGTTSTSTVGVTEITASVMATGSVAAHKPLIPSYRLFEDPVDPRAADGGIKATATTSRLSGSSTSDQSKVGGSY